MSSHFNLKQPRGGIWLITFIFYLHLVTIILNQNSPLFIAKLEVLENQFLIFQNFPHGRNCQWCQWQREKWGGRENFVLLPNNNKHPLAFGVFPICLLRTMLLMGPIRRMLWHGEQLNKSNTVLGIWFKSCDTFSKRNKNVQQTWVIRTRWFSALF